MSAKKKNRPHLAVAVPARHESLMTLGGTVMAENGKTQTTPYGFITPQVAFMAKDTPPKYLERISKSVEHIVGVGCNDIEHGPYIDERFDDKGRYVEGGMGRVRKVVLKATGEVLALKEVPVSEPMRDQQMREIKALSLCTHPNIVQFRGAFASGVVLHIVTEYMDAGSLYFLYTEKCGVIPENIITRTAYGVLSAMDYMKKVHKLMHRDIKPSNILVNSKGEIKICDMGVSGMLVDSMAKSNVGTNIYIAPERIASTGNYSIKADIWSLGLSLVELAIGRYPYADKVLTGGMFARLLHVKNTDPPFLPLSKSCPGQFSAEFDQFLASSLQRDPNARFGIGRLLDLPFIKQGQAVTDAEVAAWVMETLSHTRPLGGFPHLYEPPPIVGGGSDDEADGVDMHGAHRLMETETLASTVSTAPSDATATTRTLEPTASTASADTVATVADSRATESAGGESGGNSSGEGSGGVVGVPARQLMRGGVTPAFEYLRRHPHPSVVEGAAAAAAPAPGTPRGAVPAPGVGPRGPRPGVNPPALPSRLAVAASLQAGSGMSGSETAAQGASAAVPRPGSPTLVLRPLTPLSAVDFSSSSNGSPSPSEPVSSTARGFPSRVRSPLARSSPFSVSEPSDLSKSEEIPAVSDTRSPHLERVPAPTHPLAEPSIPPSAPTGAADSSTRVGARVHGPTIRVNTGTPVTGGTLAALPDVGLETPTPTSSRARHHQLLFCEGGPATPGSDGASTPGTPHTGPNTMPHAPAFTASPPSAVPDRAAAASPPERAPAALAVLPPTKGALPRSPRIVPGVGAAPATTATTTTTLEAVRAASMEALRIALGSCDEYTGHPTASAPAVAAPQLGSAGGDDRPRVDVATSGAALAKKGGSRPLPPLPGDSDEDGAHRGSPPSQS